MSPFLLIVLLPLAGFLVNGLAGRRLGERASAWVGCSTVGASFALSFGAWRALLNLPAEAREIHVPVYTWISSGDFEAAFGFLIDPLSATLMLVVTGVGFLIHLYSAGYMHGDEGFSRYFAYLNLFTFSMLLLVMGDNLVLMFVGWEGVGLCSYLLIGFWYKQKEPPAAGMKAFIVNRIGDFGFALGIFLLFAAFGTVSYAPLRDAATLFAGHSVTLWGAPIAAETVFTAAALLLFVGAVGKSAQIPLYVWLPDAMAGPTPVSALIHAATMVTAGVYMVARMEFLYLQSPCAMSVVAVVGAATALYAATMALVQRDIKKVLAYSTISQLGYMFLACGVGAFSAGVFHLMTHAFFKALLFLGAGSVIHALSGEQDIFKMGGLRKRLPATHATFLVGTLAIAGAPGLAGFFSKDAVLARAFEQGGALLWGAGVLTAGLTAFYMFRLYFLAFTGGSRVEPEREKHLHESPPSMTVPLGVLAALSVAGGWLGVPHALHGGDRFGAWLASWGGAHETALSHAVEWGLMAVSVGVAGFGAFFAYRLYLASPGGAARMKERFEGLHRLLSAKYYVDEIYDALFVRPLVKVSVRVWRAMDVKAIDGAAHGLASFTEWKGNALALLQTGAVRHQLFWMLAGAMLVLFAILGWGETFGWLGEALRAAASRVKGWMG